MQKSVSVKNNPSGFLKQGDASVKMTDRYRDGHLGVDTCDGEC